MRHLDRISAVARSERCVEAHWNTEAAAAAANANLGAAAAAVHGAHVHERAPASDGRERMEHYIHSPGGTHTAAGGVGRAAAVGAGLRERLAGEEDGRLRAPRGRPRPAPSVPWQRAAPVAAALGDTSGAVVVAAVAAAVRTWMHWLPHSGMAVERAEEVEEELTDSSYHAVQNDHSTRVGVTAEAVAPPAAAKVA